MVRFSDDESRNDKNRDIHGNIKGEINNYNSINDWATIFKDRPSKPVYYDEDKINKNRTMLQFNKKLFKSILEKFRKLESNASLGRDIKGTVSIGKNHDKELYDSLFKNVDDETKMKEEKHSRDLTDFLVKFISGSNKYNELSNESKNAVIKLYYYLTKVGESGNPIFNDDEIREFLNNEDIKDLSIKDGILSILNYKEPEKPKPSFVNLFQNDNNSLVSSITVRNTQSIEEFYVMWRDELSAKVIVDSKRQVVDVKQYTDDILARPFLKRDEDVTVDDVMNFLEDRCFPRERVNARQLLNDLGLKSYNPLRIVKKTHGLMVDDFLWIKFRGEKVTYDNIKIRRD